MYVYIYTQVIFMDAASSFEYCMMWICVFENIFLCLCPHREMDRLGIITPSHQDLLIASVQQEVLSQMRHMQHTMVPVWAGEGSRPLLRRISFTSSMHFRETFNQWKYKEWLILIQENGKNCTFVNFHSVEFCENRDLDVETRMALSYCELRASSSYPVLFLIILLSVLWRLKC